MVCAFRVCQGQLPVLCKVSLHTINAAVKHTLIPESMEILTKSMECEM